MFFPIVSIEPLGLVVSGKIFFHGFPILSLWQIMTTPECDPCMEPRGTVGRICKEDRYTLLHTKYESSEPCGFGEEVVFFPL